VRAVVAGRVGGERTAVRRAEKERAKGESRGRRRTDEGKVKSGKGKK
jgi:hypothetical protein